MKRIVSQFSKMMRPPDPSEPLRRRIDFGDSQPAYAIYAVGDIHGCIDLLAGAEELISADISRTGVAGLVIYLGDYVDRGPNSAAVLQHLLSPESRRLKRLPLCGNHEELFLRFLSAPERNRSWLEIGGKETLLSYGITVVDRFFDSPAETDLLRASLRSRIPQAHIGLLKSLPICLKIGSYIFVHAGVRPGRSLEDQSDSDLMWIREPFISLGPKLPYTLVHGHTPSKVPSFGPNRIGIDTGAYVTGKLSVLRILDGAHSFL